MTRVPALLVLACGVVGCSSSTEDVPVGHVFHVDFAATTPHTIDGWVVLSPSETSRAGLVDFATREVTDVSIAAENWSGTHESPTNWSADVDWLPVVAAQGAWTQGLGETTPATVTFRGLAGDYRVEVVAAEGIQAFTQRTTVNGATTTVTRQGAIADSAAWDPQADGTVRSDWLVWPSVTAAGGQITIEQLTGWINAVRLSPAG